MIYKAPTSIKNHGALRVVGHYGVRIGWLKIMCFRCQRIGSGEELRILAGNKFKIFGAEIRNTREPNSRLCRGTESWKEEEDRRVRAWVHNVVTVRTGKVAGQCAMPYTPRCVTPQSGNRISTSLGNNGLCWTVFARNRDTAVPAEGNGDYQTLICVLVARPRRCLTLLNPVPWQNWMAAYLGYTLRMRTLFRGWSILVNDTHMRRRSL